MLDLLLSKVETFLASSTTAPQSHLAPAQHRPVERRAARASRLMPQPCRPVCPSLERRNRGGCAGGKSSAEARHGKAETGIEAEARRQDAVLRRARGNDDRSR